jgi:hypothetical protein
MGSMKFKFTEPHLAFECIGGLRSISECDSIILIFTDFHSNLL